MSIPFAKYQGTGNDFVMIDNRDSSFPKDNVALVKKLCDRRFGVGADGLILLENHPQFDFKMVYYNSDGRISTMCGNGGRCLVAFARDLGVITSSATFEAIDGVHYATIAQNVVSLQMQDILKDAIKITGDYVFLDTGSPHHVTVVNDLPAFDVVNSGRKIRESALYGEAGSNVNFVEYINEDTVAVRTYERGVENETLSCGTGVTAVAIAAFETKKIAVTSITTQVEGGQLMVKFTPSESGYTDVFLIGKAVAVFTGIW